MTAVQSTDAGAGNRFAVAVDSTAAGLNELTQNRNVCQVAAMFAKLSGRVIPVTLYSCRNYLEYVAESIADWLKEKEAEYQAHLLSAEVEQIRHDDEADSKTGEKKGKKSPRKSGMGI